jgi:hypothetical protein
MDGGYEFYFDECVLGAAKRLREQGFEVLHPEHPAIPHCGMAARTPLGCQRSRDWGSSV